MAERLGTVDQLRPRWTKEQIAEKRGRIAETIEKCGSWKELARALAVDGITLERKGQGIVLGDATGTMKLSDLKKDIRLKPLEERFGQTWADYEHVRDHEPTLDPAMKPDDDTSADNGAAQTNAAPQQEPEQATPSTPAEEHVQDLLGGVPAIAVTPQKPKTGGEEASGAIPSSASPLPQKIKLPLVTDASEATESAQQATAQKAVEEPIAAQEPEQVRTRVPKQQLQSEPRAPRMDPAEFAAKWQTKVKMLEEHEAEKNAKPSWN